YKYYKNGTRCRNMRGHVMKPEGIYLLNLSGKWLYENELKMDYHCVRPSGYQNKKSEEMIRSMIMQTTKKYDIVLDPFLGSGVTVTESIKLKRSIVGIEIKKHPVEELFKHIC